jgi:hypothetical protein
MILNFFHGLYQNIAIPDSGNFSRRVAETRDVVTPESLPSFPVSLYEYKRKPFEPIMKRSSSALGTQSLHRPH